MGTPKQMPGFLKANFSSSTGPPGKETNWVPSVKGGLSAGIHARPPWKSCSNALSADSILLSPKIGGDSIRRVGVKTQLINEGFGGA